MKIVGTRGMSYDQVKSEVDKGASFVRFRGCISLVVITFSLPSDVHFVRGVPSRIIAALPPTLMSLFLGWWGIPWGPIRTIQSLATNLRGGEDVTAEALAAIRPPQPPHQKKLPEKRQSIRGAGGVQDS